MANSLTTTSPTFSIIGTDAEPSDASISALARLLLAVADDTHTNDTSPPAAAVECVFQSAANKELD